MQIDQFGTLISTDENDLKGDTLYIPTGVKKIGPNAVGFMKNLSKVVLPNTVVEIKPKAFFTCVALSSINIPDSVTTIGDEAFQFCMMLENITLPDSITSIGENCFYPNTKFNCSDRITNMINSSSQWNPVIHSSPENNFFLADNRGTKHLSGKMVFVNHNDVLNHSKIKIAGSNSSIRVGRNKRPLLSSFINSNDLFIQFEKVSKKQLETFIKKNKDDLSLFYGTSKAILNINGDLLDSDYIDKVKFAVDKLTDLGLNIDVSLYKPERKAITDEVFYFYSPKQIALLDDLNKHIKEKTGNELLYQEVSYKADGNLRWKHSQVKTANENLDSLVDSIKKINPKLSPFETMILIHDFVTNFEYKQEYDKSEGTHEVFSTPINLLQNIKDIKSKASAPFVCVGYSSFVKAIIDRLNMPGLKCEMNPCNVDDKDQYKEKNGGHATNIITIEDDKYDIHGSFLEDACFDSKRKGNTILDLTHCLQSFDDLDKMDKYKFGFFTNTSLNSMYTSFDPKKTKMETVSQYRKSHPRNYGQSIPISKYKDALETILINQGYSEMDASMETYSICKNTINSKISWYGNNYTSETIDLPHISDEKF